MVGPLTPSSVKHFFWILLCLKVTVFRKSLEIRLTFVNLYQELKYVINSFVEDDLHWKTTFDARQPLMEDTLWWKTTFDGRQPLMEDDL